MTQIVFKQPPLVEIIADVRWDIPGVPGVPEQLMGAPLPVPDASAHEIHFMNFASKAGAKGFGLVERVIPPGFPLFAHQAAFRYRNTTGVSGAPLFQLGPGIFSINIVPPYKSWKSFIPFVDLGLDLLLDSRSPEDKGRPFSSVRLRYIDAFGENLRQGKSTVAFLSENLGVKIQLPESVTKFCTDAKAMKPTLSVVMPIEKGTLELKITEGWVRNVRSLVMDTSVLFKGPLGPDKQVLRSALDAAHTIIHDSFVGMTSSLHELMDPEEQG
jgi:uncharacterized protein (TIGR04255 family)